MNEKKEVYVQPALVTHELLRDITSGFSGICDRFPRLAQKLRRCD